MVRSPELESLIEERFVITKRTRIINEGRKKTSKFAADQICSDTILGLRRRRAKKKRKEEK